MLLKVLFFGGSTHVVIVISMCVNFTLLIVIGKPYCLNPRKSIKETEIKRCTEADGDIYSQYCPESGHLFSRTHCQTFTPFMRCLLNHWYLETDFNGIMIFRSKNHAICQTVLLDGMRVRYTWSTCFYHCTWIDIKCLFLRFCKYIRSYYHFYYKDLVEKNLKTNKQEQTYKKPSKHSSYHHPRFVRFLAKFLTKNN
jgi:hypothetical protein